MQSYEPDNRITYQFKDGCRSTTNGRPWCMHTFALNAWDPVGKRLVVSAQPIHYGLEELQQITIPKNSMGCWWEYDPAEGLWSAIANAPELGLGHLCYVPTQKKFIAFNGGNDAVALYDPHMNSIKHLKSSHGPSPNGYTLKSAYDVKRDRILLVSWNKQSRLWAFDIKTRRWTDLKTANTPMSGIYGSWDYDVSADTIVSLWSENPEGGFSNKSGTSRTFLCDLEKNIWIEHKTEPSAPYTGMSYKMVYDPRHKVTLYLAGLDLWSFKAPVQ